MASLYRFLDFVGCNMRSMGSASNTTMKLNHATVLKISYKNNMLLCLSHSYYTFSNFISKKLYLWAGTKVLNHFSQVWKNVGRCHSSTFVVKSHTVSLFYCRACKYTGPNERHVFLRSMLIVTLTRDLSTEFIIGKF